MGLMTVGMSALRAAAETPAETTMELKPGENLWVVLLIAVLGSSVVAGIISAAVSGVRNAATARREGYTRAVETLIARAEYPYRVRRRVSDDPEVLAALVSQGHELQERLAGCRTWVASENSHLGRRYERALATIDSGVGPATRDAWDAPPISTAAGMNLDGWGPCNPWRHLLNLERAISYRFGPRRLVPSLVWRLWLRW